MDNATLDQEIVIAISVCDYFTAQHALRTDTIIGEVVTSTMEAVEVKKYVFMSETLLRKFSLQPIVASIFPVVSNLAVPEFIITSEVVKISRKEIVGAAFIFPIKSWRVG